MSPFSDRPSGRGGIWQADGGATDGEDSLGRAGSQADGTGNGFTEVIDYYGNQTSDFEPTSSLDDYNTSELLRSGRTDTVDYSMPGPSSARSFPEEQLASSRRPARLRQIDGTLAGPPRFGYIQRTKSGWFEKAEKPNQRQSSEEWVDMRESEDVSPLETDHDVSDVGSVRPPAPLFGRRRQARDNGSDAQPTVGRGLHGRNGSPVPDLNGLANGTNALPHASSDHLLESQNASYAHSMFVNDSLAGHSDTSLPLPSAMNQKCDVEDCHHSSHQGSSSNKPVAVQSRAIRRNAGHNVPGPYQSSQIDTRSPKHGDVIGEVQFTNFAAFGQAAMLESGSTPFPAITYTNQSPFRRMSREISARLKNARDYLCHPENGDRPALRDPPSRQTRAQELRQEAISKLAIRYCTIMPICLPLLMFWSGFSNAYVSWLSDGEVLEFRQKFKMKAAWRLLIWVGVILILSLAADVAVRAEQDWQ